MSEFLGSLRSTATWTEAQVAERRRALVRASLIWWVRVVVVSGAAFVSLILIERRAPALLAALPVLAATLAWLLQAPRGRRSHALWGLAAAVVVGALCSALSAGAVLLSLVALMFGAWTVAFLALVAAWGHWGAATFLIRARGFTEHVRDQTQQAVSREQGSLK